MRTKLRNVFMAACVGTCVAVVGVSAAAAESGTIGGSQRAGTLVEWNTARTNVKNPSAVTFRLDAHNPGTGAPFGIGLRNATGQFARADLNTGQTAPLRLASGSTALPRGTFFINSRVNGACGGDGCVVTWSGLLSWNL